MCPATRTRLCDAARVVGESLAVWPEGSRGFPVERIYCDQDRSFGAALDDPDYRLAYYMEVWNRVLQEDL